MYTALEKTFESFVSIATKILGNPIAFILAFALVIYWWINILFFTTNSAQQEIGDLLIGITFLFLFIIQKSVNRYTALIHLKLNELVSSNQHANNSVLNTSEKTENQIIEMAKEYAEALIEEEVELIISKDKKENDL